MGSVLHVLFGVDVHLRVTYQSERRYCLHGAPSADQKRNFWSWWLWYSGTEECDNIGKYVFFYWIHITQRGSFTEVFHKLFKK